MATTYEKLETESEDIISQTLITYIKEKDAVRKVSITRKFFSDGDYIDSTTTEMLS